MTRPPSRTHYRNSTSSHRRSRRPRSRIVEGRLVAVGDELSLEALATLAADPFDAAALRALMEEDATLAALAADDALLDVISPDEEMISGLTAERDPDAPSSKDGAR